MYKCLFVASMQRDIYQKALVNRTVSCVVIKTVLINHIQIMQLYNMCSALYELPNVCIFVMILKLAQSCV